MPIGSIFTLCGVATTLVAIVIIPNERFSGIITAFAGFALCLTGLIMVL